MRSHLVAALALSTLVACGSVVAKPDAQEQQIDAPAQIDAAIDAAIDATSTLCSPMDCGDSDMCTTDTCDGNATCQHAPITCDDTNACTSNACAPAVGCVYTQINPTGSQTIAYNGGTQTFTVPACETSLRITAQGAQGGGSNGQVGGRGASMAGDFTVTPGDIITIRVGGAGIDGQLAPAGLASQRGGTGGGGTYVIRNGTILVIAGGGGGAIGGFGFGQAPGGPGQITANGQAGEPAGAAGGTGGTGGGTNLNTAYHGSTGGGGYTGNGLAASTGDTASYGTANQPGMSYLNGSAGGAGGSQGRNGAFGGGGSSGYTGGGGGGYSGGGAGANILTGGTATHNGGGGGSLNNGANQTNTPGARAGNGVVTITW